MKYTAATRRTAILICQVAAMTHDLHDAYGPVALRLGLGPESSPAIGLAHAAWSAVRLSNVHHTGGQVDGEAECLLRDGWSPGEPTRVG